MAEDLLPDLHEELFRHLEVKGDIELQFALFTLFMKTNERRVNMAYKLLAENGLLPDLSLDGKSGTKSEEYRQKGNEMFKKKKAREAHEFYTRSIAFAEAGSEHLALAYANRSAVLFEKGLYEECLKDIEFALQCNYPEHLKSKLIARQTKAKNLLPTREKVGFFTPVPSISKEKQNPLRQSAANSVRIEKSETMGRHIVATRDIEPGEIIAIEKPFCQVLTDELYIHCHHCLTICYTLIPCPKCSEALFCSETCQMNANQAYHQYECPLLLTITKLSPNVKLCLRLTLLVNDKYKSLVPYGPDKHGAYRSDRYNEIHNLSTNTSNWIVSELFGMAVVAAAFYHLLKKFTKFFDNENKDFEAIFKEFMLFHIQIGGCNFHEIVERKSSDNPLKALKRETIGVGVYSFLSMFNHSCCSNVFRYCYGPTMIAITNGRIRKGEQCFDNYGCEYEITPREERQAILKRHYCFDCTCAACVNNYPQYDVVAKIKEDPELFLISLLMDMKIVQGGNVEEAREIFNVLIGKIKKLGESKSENKLAELHECLKKCLLVFAIIKTPI